MRPFNFGTCNASRLSTDTRLWPLRDGVTEYLKIYFVGFPLAEKPSTCRETALDTIATTTIAISLDPEGFKPMSSPVTTVESTSVLEWPAEANRLSARVACQTWVPVPDHAVAQEQAFGLRRSA